MSQKGNYYIDLTEAFTITRQGAENQKNIIVTSRNSKGKLKVSVQKVYEKPDSRNITKILKHK